MQESRRAMRRVDPPDGGWGWVVVAAVFITAMLTFGSMSVYPLFYEPLMREFDVGLGEVTWLTGCTEFGRIFGYVTTGTLIAKMGFRGTSLCVSILCGISISVASLANSLVLVFVFVGLATGVILSICGVTYAALIPRYFKKKRVMAISLALSGTPVGLLALAPFMQFLIEFYNWRGAVLILGGLTLNCAVVASLYRPILLNSDPTPSEENSTEDKNWRQALKPLKEVLVLPKFWIFSVIWLLMLSTWLLYMRFLVPYSLSLDVEPMMASLLLSIYSGVSIFARIAFGILGDRKNVNIVWVLIITGTMGAFVTASMWFVHNLVGLILNCIAHSLVSGGIHSMYAQVMASVLDDKNLTWGFNTSGLLYSVLGSWVTPLVGMLVDELSDIRYAFIVAALMQLLAIFLHIPLLSIKRR